MSDDVNKQIKTCNKCLLKSPKLLHGTVFPINELAKVGWNDLRIGKKSSRSACLDAINSDNCDDTTLEVTNPIIYEANDIEAANTLLTLHNHNTKKEGKTFEDKGIQVNTYEDLKDFDVSDIINNDYRLEY
ncbi:hypothetical protein FQR65_LT12377 [Abscondita terminalis]|nr:hypothetical protein FQR65_LT12377 [Abscondita terminalis]